MDESNNTTQHSGEDNQKVMNGLWETEKPEYVDAEHRESSWRWKRLTE